VTIARIGLVAVAVVACAWFALGIRQAHEIAQATSIVSQARAPTPSQAREADALLGSAGALNPNLEVDVLRGRVALARGNLVGARRILTSVVRREPENVEAWIWLARASNDSPATFRLAVTRVEQLIPTLPARR
jgi:predicted Zn-dependent protease